MMVMWMDEEPYIPWYLWPVCAVLLVFGLMEWWISPDTDRM